MYHIFCTTLFLSFPSSIHITSSIARLLFPRYFRWMDNKKHTSRGNDKTICILAYAKNGEEIEEFGLSTGSHTSFQAKCIQSAKQRELLSPVPLAPVVHGRPAETDGCWYSRKRCRVVVERSRATEPGKIDAPKPSPTSKPWREWFSRRNAASLYQKISPPSVLSPRRFFELPFNV